MTNLGPLTTTYTPTGVNCSTVYQTNANIIVYGTFPSYTSSCLPSNFNGHDPHYYSPGICPSGYTYACYAFLDHNATAATCCPTGYDCKKGRPTTDPAACVSTILTDTSLTFYRYNATNSVNSTTLVTNFYAAGNSAYAPGVVLRRASDDPEWPNSGSTTSRISGDSTATKTGASGTQGGTDSNGDSGLSSGAKIGIGVGVACGVLALIGAAVAAFLIGRQNRRAARVQALQNSPQPYAGQQPYMGDQQSYMGVQQSYVGGLSPGSDKERGYGGTPPVGTPLVGAPPVEMGVQNHSPSELPTQYGAPAELAGEGTRRSGY